MQQLKTILQEKHPETGEATGKFSFSRIFASIVGTVGCLIMVGGLYSQMFHDPVRLGMKSAVIYGGGLVVFATMIYSQKVAQVAARIAEKRFGGSD